MKHPIRLGTAAALLLLPLLLSGQAVPDSDQSIYASRIQTELPQTPEEVLQVLEKVPREPFIPTHFRRFSPSLSALPGHGSLPLPNPITVTRILSALPRNDKNLKVLIGGYETAYPALLAARLLEPSKGTVIATEADKRAFSAGEEALGQLPEQKNLSYLKGLGPAFWMAEGPFDAVVLFQPLTEIDSMYRDLLKPRGKGFFQWKSGGGGLEWVILSKDSDSPLLQGLPVMEKEGTP